MFKKKKDDNTSALAAPSSGETVAKKKWYEFFDFNSPVVLSLFFIALALVIIDSFTGGAARNFFAVRFTRWSDPLMYMRLFTHPLAHRDWTHFIGNFTLFLIAGPMLEEKYGSWGLVRMFLITAGITGLIIIITKGGLLGASGLVLMAILLASFTNTKGGKLPVTALIVGVMWIGKDVVAGIQDVLSSGNDGISQMAHIIGGVCGAAFGFAYARGTGKGGEG